MTIRLAVLSFFGRSLSLLIVKLAMFDLVIITAYIPIFLQVEQQPQQAPEEAEVEGSEEGTSFK